MFHISVEIVLALMESFLDVILLPLLFLCRPCENIGIKSFSSKILGSPERESSPCKVISSGNRDPSGFLGCTCKVHVHADKHRIGINN
jgi:hypothetical protein